MEDIDKITQRSYFGGGCFWGVEETFRQTKGVVNTAVGYMGGNTDNPSYEEVCSDTTGHVEIVEVEYNPEEITYEELLKVFWESHDPTQVNRQGLDVGKQYRSVIFFTTPEQKEMAEKSKKELQESGRYGVQTIATAIEEAGTFNRAEEYHQQYLAKRGQKVCH